MVFVVTRWSRKFLFRLRLYYMKEFVLSRLWPTSPASAFCISLPCQTVCRMSGLNCWRIMHVDGQPRRKIKERKSLAGREFTPRISTAEAMSQGSIEKAQPQRLYQQRDITPDNMNDSMDDIGRWQSQYDM